MNLEIVKLVLEKAEDQRSNCQHHWITEKAREFQKNIYLCFIDYTKAFDGIYDWANGCPAHVPVCPAQSCGLI